MNVLKRKLIFVDNYLYELSVTLLTRMTVLTYYHTIMFVIACNLFFFYSTTLSLVLIVLFFSRVPLDCLRHYYDRDLKTQYKAELSEICR